MTRHFDRIPGSEPLKAFSRMVLGSARKEALEKGNPGSLEFPIIRKHNGFTRYRPSRFGKFPKDADSVWWLIGRDHESESSL